MKKVKSILFRVNAKGRGIINFDASHQKRLTKYMFFGPERNDDNISYSKKVFSIDEEGRTTYKIMVSSQCVNHEVYGMEVPSMGQDIVAIEDLKFDFIASKTALLRGYMLTDSSKTEDAKGAVIKRKSPITLTDFIQTNNAKSYIPIGTASGVRDSNSMYFKETIGDIEYASIGNSINLRELQFVSLDVRHDREAFSAEKFDLFREKFTETYPEFKSEIKYFLTNGSKIKIPELGFILPNDIMLDMLKFYFKNLLFTRITRNKSFFEVNDVQIKLVRDPFVDTYSNEDGWMDLDLDTINNLDFDVEDFYTEFNSEEAEMILGNIKDFTKDKKENKKILKDKEAEKKDKIKAEKESKKNEKVSK